MEVTGTSSASFGSAGSSSAQPEHLRWLNEKDKLIYFRGQCLEALRQEQRLLRDIRSTMSSYRKATEFCKAGSEADPEWFTLDVQDCQSRRVGILRDVLCALEADPLPPPGEAQVVDRIRGHMYSGYAKTAEVTNQVASGIQNNETVQGVAAATRTAVGRLAESAVELAGQAAAGIARHQRQSPTASRGSWQAPEAPSCAVCPEPILGAVVMQDGKPHHFGCIDQARAWSEAATESTASAASWSAPRQEQEVAASSSSTAGPPAAAAAPPAQPSPPATREEPQAADSQPECRGESTAAPPAAPAAEPPSLAAIPVAAETGPPPPAAASE
mmetsp:Transcript_11424/g.26404  ORF Transcript_11424/g.26404 Transcript_11424/m.26404 type:complete len:329 (+) Transcript_11424:110-1096(+)